MDLGAFSISLVVKNLQASNDFYNQLGFETMGGDADQGWLILKNGDHIIGLFHGMFEKNMLTFNPGWDQNAKNLDSFTDVRDIQNTLKENGIAFDTEADEASAGPASFVIIDPDGNPIMFDQHR